MKARSMTSWFSRPVLFALLLAVAGTAMGAGPEDEQARQILDAAGVKGGLVVHLGCGDGELTAALRGGDPYLVQGLDTDAANVAAAREQILARGCYGPVCVDTFDGEHLPYSDGIVDLLVAEELGNVTMDEVTRVLCPNGVALVSGVRGQGPGVRGEGFEMGGRRWSKAVKPWPAEIDQWTHFLHDASNNAVARDMQVGPPRRLRWVAGPLWSRSHEFKSSLCAMVSAGGRVFYIFDEGLTSITDPPIPERWILIARDAFNGVLLWKRPVEWGADGWKNAALRSVPPSIPRLLVAEGDRVFVTLGYGAPVSALDAATGETVTTYERTEGTEELRCLQGVLLLRKGKDRLMAIDTRSGAKMWEATGKIRPFSVAAQHNKVFYQDGVSLVCIGLKDGEELWRTASQSPASLLLVSDDLVLLSSKSGLEAVSVDTGAPIWTAAARVGRNELFVANKQVWHWEGQGIVGRDLRTGKVTTTLDTSDVFTPGHHLRCYQSKATERFLITPNRGVEFVSVTGAENTQNDWVRGACRYGVMPSNGLLYVPPHPCFCYPGVKLTGFNVLAPKGEEALGAVDEGVKTARLERGPAYGSGTPAPSPLAAGPADDWPTYRHDPRRTGATTCEVPPQVARRWRVRLQGSLTPPVVSGDRVYVADKDQHTLHALHVEDGRRLWQFTAAGRIDSPPTLYPLVVPPSGGERGEADENPPEGGTANTLCLFGCADGRVYCLRADDGELVWRFRAAPSDRRIVAFGQLESPWRVHGSILVEEGVAYFTAGRSSYLDGGIWVFGLDPKTGKVLHQTRLDTWERTREDAKGKPFVPAYHIEGTHSDILVSQGDSIYLGQVKFDRKLARQEVPYIVPGPEDRTVAMDLSRQPFVAEDMDPKGEYERRQREWLERTQKDLLQQLRGAYGGYSLGDRQIGLHVFTPAGFLDDTWFNRTFWMYSATWPGYYIAHRASKTGQLLVVGPEKTYAVQGYPTRNFQSPLFVPGEKGYLLLADANDNEPVLDHRTRGTTKGWGFTRMKPPVWHDWVPVRVRAMVLAAGHLFVAGPPDVVDPDDPMAAFEGRKGAVLRALSAADGKTLAEGRLEAPPVFDGLIAASERLYLSLEDGTVLCLGGR